MYGWNDGWGFGVMLLALVFLAAIVVGGILIARSFGDGSRGPTRPDSNRALDVLDERFARGEIDQAEYDERRRVLTQGR